MFFVLCHCSAVFLSICSFLSESVVLSICSFLSESVVLSICSFLSESVFLSICSFLSDSSLPEHLGQHTGAERNRPLHDAGP